MDHPWLQLLDAWLLGMDVDDYYEWMLERLAALPPGPSLDIPSGGGPFLGRVPIYQQGGPWLFADLSWTMLRHIRHKCEALGLHEVVLLRADAARLPLRDRALHNLVSLFGFHCFHDKAAVFAEMSRCLRPGGRIIASTLTSDGPRRSRFYLKLNQRDGTFASNNSLHEFKEQAQRQSLSLNVLNQLGAAAVLEMHHDD
ncbi:class I SAM-dependent methyltransferase [Archangium sp.]|uniref:class I SAM-dependent methyltransferase n=1 Tax=Archangium sp. TaxID=1872627 RepID=UPI002D2FE66B|nr:class I SAM-dependent methyltransferase [Archangium sp.]HYO52463.1 class I SAM-dependent methyltransferase [Archangium sp.]